MTRTAQRIGRLLGGTLLNLAALGGVICIAAVIAAVFFSVSLIMFKTGSMSPTIPAGSLALVREIPAAGVQVGDIVTVDRSGLLPITHRVVAITPGDDGAASITLRGDANTVNDPEPYLVTHVRIVLLSLPGLAGVISALSQGPVMSVITVAAATLVTWAFWPRKSESRSPRHGAARVT